MPLTYDYSEELRREILELFPNSRNIKEALANGSEILGRYLDDSTNGIGITADEILLANNLMEVQDKVRLHKRKKAVYNKWCTETNRNQS